MLTIKELSDKLESTAKENPHIAELLKEAAQRLRWQDDRYRMLSKLAWGDKDTPSVLVPRKMVK